jgi:hypothetical protein
MTPGFTIGECVTHNLMGMAIPRRQHQSIPRTPLNKSLGPQPNTSGFTIVGTIRTDQPHQRLQHLYLFSMGTSRLTERPPSHPMTGKIGTLLLLLLSSRRTIPSSSAFRVCSTTRIFLSSGLATRRNVMLCPLSAQDLRTSEIAPCRLDLIVPNSRVSDSRNQIAVPVVFFRQRTAIAG